MGASDYSEPGTNDAARPLLQGKGEEPGASGPSDYSYKGPRYNEQPPRQRPRVSEGWHHSLFGCLSDIPLCLKTCFCPCVTVGQNVEVIDNGVTPCFMGAFFWYLFMQVSGCGCLYSCMYRSRLRAKYHLPEEPCLDCCVHGFCLPCALCQEYKELRTRGSDPALGWSSQRTVTVAPQPQRLQ